jgi:hypothetical protein
MECSHILLAGRRDCLARTGVSLASHRRFGQRETPVPTCSFLSPKDLPLKAPYVWYLANFENLRYTQFMHTLSERTVNSRRESYPVHRDQALGVCGFGMSDGARFS